MTDFPRLTGRQRYRIQHRWFGKPLVVLQVQWESQHEEFLGTFVDIRYYKHWEDARVQDVTTAETVTTTELEGHP
jgi:hypothetical protein